MTSFTVKYDGTTDKAIFEVTCDVGKTEGETLIDWVGEHLEHICQFAIALNINEIQTVCGEIAYPPVTPKTFLPLLSLNQGLNQLRDRA
jgi:hypothetical protein